MAPSGDPMSGLLSGVGGIDASLFQRPQAMKDMKAKAPVKQPQSEVGKAPIAPPQAPQNHSPEPVTGTRQPHPQRPAEAAGAASTRKPAQVTSSSSNKDPFSDSDFGSLLGDSNFSKQGRQAPILQSLQESCKLHGGFPLTRSCM